MAGEQAKSRGLARVSGDDLPYAGVIGRTRSEAVQVLMPDGSLRSLSAYTGVDAVSDPALAALARAGTLHHVADGVELALAFTYHDPSVRLFVLVVPEGLRHRALALRAEVMQAIASEPQHAVPEYVRDVELVVGARGLVRRLDAPAAAAHPRAEVVSAAAARALAERERELALRERLIEARERALLQLPANSDRVHDSEIEELDDSDAELFEPALVAADDGEPAEEATGLEEVEELDGSEADLEEGDVIPFQPRDRAASFVRLAELRDPFAFDPLAHLALIESGGHVWLFVRGRPNARVGQSGMELLVQLDPSRAIPVVLVSLVFDVDGSPEVRRGVVDPWVPAQRNALHALAQHFEVALVAYSKEGLDYFATLHTPREANVRAILAQLARADETDRESWERAREELLASPPPWRDLTHPFQGGAPPEPPVTATEAAVLVDELSDWLQPERKARLKLALCVPDEVVDATYRAGIGYALDWGLALSPELAGRALELGIEKDEAALLVRRIEGLCRTSKESDFGGLEEGVLRAEWSEALEQAARLGVALPGEALTLAKQHAGERALVHASALSDTRDAALEPARERARSEPPERAALEQLLASGSYRDVLEACRLAHKLGPEVAGALFAMAARRSDPVALDALLTLLGPSELLLVRAGAALALASRRALNALDDLTAHVARESEPEYRVFALALGRYGAGSFRAIAGAMRKQDVDPERAALVYAHLALHGARAQVRAKARAREPREAQLAQRALALATELKDGKNQALGLEQQGPLTVFCEMFDRLCRDTVGERR